MVTVGQDPFNAPEGIDSTGAEYLIERRLNAGTGRRADDKAVLRYLIYTATVAFLMGFVFAKGGLI